MANAETGVGVVNRILEGAAHLLAGTPLGKPLEALAGHVRACSEAAADATRSVTFTIAAIALSAKMAKADGIVTEAEIAAFRRLFQFDPEETVHVTTVFDRARRDAAGFETYARQVAGLFGERHPVLEELLECLFQVAEADGTVHEKEVEYLAAVARIFGFAEQDFCRLMASHNATAGACCDPFHVLGVPPGADRERVRTAYHALVREHHPDKLIAAGMPRELIELATQRMAAINAAYSTIQKGWAVA
jgi:DnaJ like chaperone protein